jgi:protocatechuate 3,4-dioxygenase beta subunit
MRRAWIPLMLALVAGAAVLFWPSSAPSDGFGTIEAQLADDEERGPVDTNFDPEVTEQPGVEIEQAEESGLDPQREGGDLLVAKPSPSVAGEAFVLVQVVDENGAPMQGATVGVLGIPDMDDGNLEGLQPILFTVQGTPVKDFVVSERISDVEGKVRLGAPIDQQIVVYARMSRHLISFQLRDPLEAGEEADMGQLRLAPGGYLEVRVIDELGGPVEDAAVIAQLNQGGSNPSELPIHYLRSDESGLAIFHHLSFKEYRLEVAKHGYRYFRENPVAITQRGDGLLEVTLSRGASMSGTVIDAHGGPVKGVTVDISSRSDRYSPDGLTRGLLGPVAAVVTDASGAFRVDGLFAEADYNLIARPPRGLAHYSREKPAEGLTLQLPETAFVSGLVLRSDGEPARSARVTFLEDVGNERRRLRPRNFRSDDEGLFEAAIPPGEYNWFIRHPSGEAASQSSLSLAGNFNLGEVWLSEGGVLEISFRRNDGSPAERVNFQSVRRTDAGAANESRALAEARRPEQRGSEGMFALRGLATGSYQLRFTSNEGLIPMIEAQTQPGVVTKLEIGLQQAAELRVDVLTREGARAAGRYRIERKDPLPAEWSHMSSSNRFRLRDNGTAQVSGLVPGTYLLRVDERGAQPFAEFTLQAGSQEREFVLPDSVK